jgi:hypothetical protein
MYDQIVEIVVQEAQKVPEHRKGSVDYSLPSCLMAGFAMFALKDPSLLSFVENFPTRKKNLEEVYKISAIPGDNGLRKILDPVLPVYFKGIFKGVLEHVDKQGVLENRRCLGKRLPIAMDGTGTYSSSNISCSDCLTKNHKNGVTEYHHQMLVASIVTPNISTVIPVFGEAITQQDGSKKNDCERNACKRIIPKIRELLPKESIIALLDALYADGPTIKALQAEDVDMDYIIVIKEGYVLEQVAQLDKKNGLQSYEWKAGKGKRCKVKWASNLILNGVNQDIKVNYLEYEEYDSKTGERKYFNKWITNIDLSTVDKKEFVAVARSRWKIENETFNTLKNQDCRLEHNYGHGKQYLATNFALLMLLAFLVDQVTHAVDAAFDLALKEAKTLRDLRQKVRVLFDFIPTISMNFIYLIIAREIDINPQFRPKLE